MSKFAFIKQKYTNKTNVWYDRIFIGTIEISIRENPDIDWDMLRADKTLRLEHEERWLYTWRASLPMNICNLGSFDTREHAAEAILGEHKRIYDKESTKGA